MPAHVVKNKMGIDGLEDLQKAIEGIEAKGESVVQIVTEPIGWLVLTERVSRVEYRGGTEWPT